MMVIKLDLKRKIIIKKKIEEETVSIYLCIKVLIILPAFSFKAFQFQICFGFCYIELLCGMNYTPYYTFYEVCFSY